MNQISKLAVTLLMTGTVLSVAHAEVTLLTPEEIHVLALDDQEVNTGLLRGKSTTYKLDPGQHSITVRYEQFFQQNDGNHDILKSGAVTVPVALQDGQTYRLQLVNPPKNFDVAKEYVNQPVIAVVDAAGKVVAQQQGVDSTPKSWLGSGLFGRVFDLRQDTKPTKPAYTAPVSTPAVAPVAIAATTTAVTAPASVNAGGNVAQLKQLWTNATPQERQQFAAWLVEQAAK